MKKLRVNNQIRIPQVRVINEKGEVIGILKTAEAINLAQSKGLDLVEVNPSANPSVAKIMDYGKYLYKKAKTERKHRSSNKAGELKSVRFAYRTGEHDLLIKAKKIAAFLKKGYKVRIEMTMKGRERSHGDVIKEKLSNFMKLIEEGYKIEQEPKRSPRGITLILSKN